MARLVVTLPPSAKGEAATGFAEAARRRGADVLEVRTDLHADGDIDPVALALRMPLLVSERERLPSEGWTQVALWVDRPIEGKTAYHPKALMSHHAERPLAPEEAVAAWRSLNLPKGAPVKHVEPLGRPSDGARLLATQKLLAAEFGAEQVTVLAMGPMALPFRCLLSEQNALEYVATEKGWLAAPGQRLLADAVRERRKKPDVTGRLAILGSHIENSRSPRIHPQPFDRIDLPEDADVGALVDALHSFYRGFSITSPFKKPLAQHVGAELPAINTLVRRPAGWGHGNTDVDGAREVLSRLSAREATVLGDGGATAALRMAAADLGVSLRVVTQAEAAGQSYGGVVVWTWPPSAGIPPRFGLKGAKVAVIAYGPPARRLGETIRQLGGTPAFLGACWFAAQARAQRRLWEEAT